MARRSVASDLRGCALAHVLVGAQGSTRHGRRLVLGPTQRVRCVSGSGDRGRPGRGGVTVLVLLGAPGAGKGTQAKLLEEKLGLRHLASGDLLRAAVAAGTHVGREADRFMRRGQLVPDSTMISVFLDRLLQPDAERGAILDGFPRTRTQAEALDAALEEAGRRV